MCNFLSAIVLKTGEIVCSPEYTDSHEDLIESRGLRDDGGDRFVRVEFLPHENEFTAVEKYALKIDGGKPAWWSDDLAEKVTEHLRGIICGAIRETVPFLILGGFHILRGKSARVMRARVLCNNSKVTAYDSSRVTAYDSSEVTAYDSSEVTAYGSSKVTAYGSSEVTACGGSAIIIDERINGGN